MKYLTGILRHPDTHDLYFPATLWDSIINKPTVNDSNIAFRLGTSDSYYEIGHFSTNSPTGNTIYIPLATTTIPGLIPALENDGNKFLNSKGTWSTPAGGGSGTVTKVSAGSGLNTTSGDTTTDGGNITSTGTLYLTKCNSTVGSFGPTQNLKNVLLNDPFTVPYITVDQFGRVTEAYNRLISHPKQRFEMNMHYVRGNMVLSPIAYALSLMWPIMKKGASNVYRSNDIHIFCNQAAINNKVGSAPVTLYENCTPAGIIILLYATYLWMYEYTAGRLILETCDEGDYINSIVFDSQQALYRSASSNSLMDTASILNTNSITLITSNWTNYEIQGCPVGRLDATQDKITRLYEELDKAGVSKNITALPTKLLHHKYIFTFKNVYHGHVDYVGPLLEYLANTDEGELTPQLFESMANDLVGGIGNAGAEGAFKPNMVVSCEHRCIDRIDTKPNRGYDILN